MAKNRTEDAFPPVEEDNDPIAPEKPEPQKIVVMREDQTAQPAPTVMAADHPVIDRVMSSNNQQKLRQAILHLSRYFHIADAEQIEGRKFFGEVAITVSWENGQAQIIRPSMKQTDMGVRSGR